jgi:uncharacterized protein
MRIEVHKVAPGGEMVEATSPLPETHMERVGIWFEQPVHLKMRISVVNRVFIALGSYETSITMECHRCLKRFQYPATSADYLWEQPVRLSGDEIIDLTEGIREDIMLRLPLKNLCSEDCKGLCPQCGKNLNEGACGCEQTRSPSAFSELDTLVQNEGDMPQ